MKTDTSFHARDQIAGRYFVYQVVSGGMGEVYLCLDLINETPIALKTFNKKYIQSTQIYDYFKEEVDKWITLGRHPNIVHCLGFEILEGQPFILLDWIAPDPQNRTDLQSWIRRGGLGLKTALTFAIDICEGLIHANRQVPNIVHRDLKPANILIDQGQIAKITDFGLATITAQADLGSLDIELLLGSGLSKVGNGKIAGTPAYMAPEQWYGDHLDARTDIYALGCILYEMLTGERAFTAIEFADISIAHIEAPLPSFEEIPTLPLELNDIVHLCLAKNPTNRYPNIEKLRNDLANLYLREFGEYPRVISYDDGISINEQVNQALTYAKILKYDKAFEVLNHLLTIDPDQAMVYLFKSLIYVDLAQFEEASENINQAVDLGLEENYYLAYRGGIRVHLHQYDDAKKDLTRAIELDSNNALSYHALGFLFYAQGQAGKALVYMNRAIELDPENPIHYINRCGCYIQNLEIDKAKNDLDKIFSQNLLYAPLIVNVMAYANRGFLYLALEHYEEALLDYNKALAININFPQIYAGRGRAYLGLRQFEKAFADFEKAIEMDPLSAVGYVAQATGYMVTQQLNKALENINHVLQILPESPDVYLLRGQVYTSMFNLNAAIVDFNYALQLQPSCVPAYILRGATYIDLQKPIEAIADLNQAITFSPKTAEAYLFRGAAYSQLLQPEKAIQDFETVFKIYPEPSPRLLVMIYHYRGAAYVLQMKTQEALENFNQALEFEDLNYPFLPPQLFASIYLQKGMLYASMELFDEAQINLEIALQIAPHLPQVYAGMGFLHAAQGKIQEAVTFFEDAVARGLPENPLITETIKQAKGEQELPFESLLNLLLESQSLDELPELVKQYPILVDQRFIFFVERMIITLANDNELKDNPFLYQLQKQVELLNLLAKDTLLTQGLSIIPQPQSETFNLQEPSEPIESASGESLDPTNKWFYDFLNFFITIESLEQMEEFITTMGLQNQQDGLLELLNLFESTFPLQLRPMFVQRIGWLRQLSK